MNLPDIHTQKLLDCLTHSRLGFALYRLPWTDECYLVLQTSGDVEQLADIQELNGKKGFVMAPFRISEEHPLVLIRPDVTAYDWSEISEALSSLECADALLTCKSRQSELSPFVSEETDKEQYTRAFGRFITPLQEKRFQKLVLSRSSARHIGDDFSPLGAFVRACNNYPRMMIYLCQKTDRKPGTFRQIIGSIPIDLRHIPVIVEFQFYERSRVQLHFISPIVTSRFDNSGSRILCSDISQQITRQNIYL